MMMIILSSSSSSSRMSISRWRIHHIQIIIIIMSIIIMLFSNEAMMMANDDCDLICLEQKQQLQRKMMMMSSTAPPDSFVGTSGNPDDYSDPLPRPVEHLRCLKTFKCSQPRPTTESPPPASSNGTSTTPTSTTAKTPTSEKVDKIHDDIEEIMEQIAGNISISSDVVDQSLDNLTTIVAEVIGIADELEIAQAVNLTSSSLSTVDVLLDQSDAWWEMQTEQRLISSAKILDILESMSKLINSKQNSTTNQSVVIELDNIRFHSKYERLHRNDSLKFDMHEAQIDLPVLGLPEKIRRIVQSSKADSKTPIPSTASMVRNKYLPAQICQRNHLEVGKPSRYELNAAVVSLVVANFTAESISLNNDYNLSLSTKNFDKLQFLDRPGCFYWDNRSQCWSNDGCTYDWTVSDRRQSHCKCDHLTSFTILVDVYFRDDPNDPVKNGLTYFASILTILLTTSSLWLSRKYNHETMNLLNDQFRTKSNLFLINFNLSIWLIISHVLVLIGIDRDSSLLQFLKNDDTGCEVTSLLLLFSLLTMISFTFLKCFHHSWYIVFSPMSTGVSAKWFLIIGYGSPVLIIILGMALYFSINNWQFRSFQELLNPFCSDYFCWISSKNYPNLIIYLFVGPTLILFSISAVLFFSILFRYCRNIHSPFSAKLLNTMLFFLNSGLAWLFSAFYINKLLPDWLNLILPYLFIGLNGLQGVWLFIEQWFKFKKRTNRVKRIKTISTKLGNGMSTRQSNGLSPSSSKRKNGFSLRSTTNKPTNESLRYGNEITGAINTRNDNNRRKTVKQEDVNNNYG